MKKSAILTVTVVLALVSFGVWHVASKEKAPLRLAQGDSILKQLQAGNQRFVAGEAREHHYGDQIKASKSGQSPEAIVLACMDSRSIPELAFDQGIGHIFTLRVAGNVISPDILASMEYGAKVVGSKLIVVLGHTSCGAITAACKDAKLGHITTLLEKIRPAVEVTKHKAQQNSCDDPKFIDAIAKQNVLDVMQQIPQKSSVLAELVKEGQVKIVGGLYDIATGKVDFF